MQADNQLAGYNWSAVPPRYRYWHCGVAEYGNVTRDEWGMGQIIGHWCPGKSEHLVETAPLVLKVRSSIVEPSGETHRWLHPVSSIHARGGGVWGRFRPPQNLKYPSQTRCLGKILTKFWPFWAIFRPASGIFQKVALPRFLELPTFGVVAPRIGRCSRLIATPSKFHRCFRHPIVVTLVGQWSLINVYSVGM